MFTHVCRPVIACEAIRKETQPQVWIASYLAKTKDKYSRRNDAIIQVS